MNSPLPNQQEDERQELDAAYYAFHLRLAFEDARQKLGEEEAKAIIEHELQNKQRTH